MKLTRKLLKNLVKEQLNLNKQKDMWVYFLPSFYLDEFLKYNSHFVYDYKRITFTNRSQIDIQNNVIYFKPELSPILISRIIDKFFGQQLKKELRLLNIQDDKINNQKETFTF